MVHELRRLLYYRPVSTNTPLLVEFSGPYSWLGDDHPSVFEAPLGQARGLYIWSINVENTDVIYYVGLTTRPFAERFLEHFKEHASGGYHLHDPREFTAGRKVQLWPGRFGAERQSVQAFIRRYEELAPAIAALSRLYRFHLAPLTSDPRSLERIEAGLANHPYASGDVVVGMFQDTGIRYRAGSLIEPPFEVEFRSQIPLRGLPDSLSV